MLFNRKPKRYISPGGQYYTLYMDMMRQHHLLIAGETGSGKSVIVNGIIYTCLLHTPDKAGLILIDPKRVELSEYKDCPHCITYASEPDQWIAALDMALAITEERYQEMQRTGSRLYNGGDIYVIIDELAYLMTVKRKEAVPRIQKLGMIARAAKVHLIACTQTVKADILPTTITCNFDSRVALRTSTAQQSRMILSRNGCELLPQYGQGFYKTPKGTTLYNIPMHPETQLADIVHYWTSSACLVA